MIHGNRPGRAAAQSRVGLVLAVLLFAFVAALLASGSAAIEFAMPWKAIAMLAAPAAIAGIYRLRARA